MQKSIEKLEQMLGSGRIKSDEPLANHTIRKQGGNAEYYVEIEKLDELIRIVKTAREEHLPICLIGAATWIEIPEEGIEGIVIKNNCRRFDVISMRGKIKDQKIGVDNAYVYAESGTNVNQLVRFTVGEGLGGLEYQLGLPGTVGGAILTNARYTPKSIYFVDAIEKIRILNKTGELQDVQADYFASLPLDASSEEIILSATFYLHPQDKKILWKRGQEAVEYRSKVAKQPNL
jgi:UDP-N-acetylmuramate dehydrogenase